MSDIYIALIYVIVLLLGFLEPFVFSLGYVWIDLFYPQILSTVLARVPVALIMGSAAIGSYVLFDRRSPPRLTMGFVLAIALAAWITLTCTWAVAPTEVVWDKWSWAFKTVLFSAFIPYVFRSRIQIEAFVQVFIFSLAVHILPSGIKTIITGGGYSTATSIVRGNSGFNESSTLAAVSIMVIPMLFSFFRYSLLIPWRRFRITLYCGYAAICGFAALGSYARTALVGFAVLAVTIWIQSRHKAALTVVLALLAVGIGTASSNAWKSRMSTIETYDQDSSAELRILIWKWTIKYASAHPFGGGFNAYYVDEMELPPNAGSMNPIVVRGRAFHSAYFEVLGEHGWIGLILFLCLLLFAIHNLVSVIFLSRHIDELAWCHDLSAAVLAALLVLMACAVFIGIAFQPMFWYLIAMSTCLRQYVVRAEAMKGP